MTALVGHGRAKSSPIDRRRKQITCFETILLAEITFEILYAQYTDDQPTIIHRIFLGRRLTLLVEGTTPGQWSTRSLWQQQCNKSIQRTLVRSCEELRRTRQSVQTARKHIRTPMMTF